MWSVTPQKIKIRELFILQFFFSLASFRDLQFPGPVLRIFGWRRQHHVRDPREAHQVELLALHLLPGRALLQHRVLALLQAGHPAVLRGQAHHGLHRHPAAELRPVRGRKLEVRQTGDYF